MRVTIEYTTDSFDYLVLKGDAEFDEGFKDNLEVLELADRLRNSKTYEEREDIANQLWEECGYDAAARMLSSEGRLEVTYEKSDEDDIDEGFYFISDNEWVDFDEFFKDFVKNGSFLIVKNSYSKRAHYYLETEIDEPFCGKFLKIADGGVSYKGEEFEFSGDAGGWIEDQQVYVLGTSSIKEEDDIIQKERDRIKTLSQANLEKISELLKEEFAAYQAISSDLKKWYSSKSFASWEEAGIPDDGETNWDELMWKTQNYIFKHSDEAKLKKLKEQGKSDGQQYKDLKDLQSKTKIWETRKDFIDQTYFVKCSFHTDPGTWEVIQKYYACEDLGAIKSWNKSTRDRILKMQSNIDILKKERDEKKMQRHTSFGYGVSGAYWDSTLKQYVGWESNEWSAVESSYQFHIDEHMKSLGKRDIGFRGKDSDEHSRRIQEWSDAMEEVEREYERRIQSIIDTVEYR